MNSSLLKTLHVAGFVLVAAVAQAAQPTDQPATDPNAKAPAADQAAADKPAAPAANADTPAATDTSKAAPAVSVTRPVEKIDINTADAATLQRLPGITEEIAQAIIAARPFKTASDLARVEGIGETRATILKSQIVASETEEKLTPTGRADANEPPKPAADPDKNATPDDQRTPATDAPDKNKNPEDQNAPGLDAGNTTTGADKSATDKTPGQK